MEMKIDDQADLLSLRLVGSFDELSADWLDVVGSRVRRVPVHVLLNFSEVSYIDSKGLGAIFDLNKQVEDLGYHIFFCDLSQQVKEVFELAGLQHILRIYESEEDARKAIALSEDG